MELSHLSLDGGSSSILESYIFHLLILAVRLEPSMTRSIVIFLGPLPGSGKTISFCGVYSVPGNGQGGLSVGSIAGAGAQDHHSAVAQEDIAPSWFLM